MFFLSNVQHLFFYFASERVSSFFLCFIYVEDAKCIVKLANPVAWETNATLKRATAKKSATCFATLVNESQCLVFFHPWIKPFTIKPVLQQMWLLYRLPKIVAESSFLLFFIGNQIHSADIPLRIKDAFALTNWSNILIREGCLALSFSPYKVPLVDYLC